jgi:hypothetical protein
MARAKKRTYETDIYGCFANCRRAAQRLAPAGRPASACLAAAQLGVAARWPG